MAKASKPPISHTERSGVVPPLESKPRKNRIHVFASEDVKADLLPSRTKAKPPNSAASEGIDHIVGVVTWFNAEKGYGFISASPQIEERIAFLVTDVGWDTQAAPVQKDDVVMFVLESTERGFLALDILPVSFADEEDARTPVVPSAQEQKTSLVDRLRVLSSLQDENTPVLAVDLLGRMGDLQSEIAKGIRTQRHKSTATKLLDWIDAVHDFMASEDYDPEIKLDKYHHFCGILSVYGTEFFLGHEDLFSRKDHLKVVENIAGISLFFHIANEQHKKAGRPTAPLGIDDKKPFLASAEAKEVGAMFERAREGAGLNKKQAERASGIHTANLRKLESGEHSPSLEKMRQYAEALDLEVRIELIPKGQS